MYLAVKNSCFDHQSKKLHFLLSSEQGNVKKWRDNRKLIQVYLFKIQSRINRGHMSGALQLFNRMLSIIQPERWVIAALKSELKPAAPSCHKGGL